MIRKFAASLAMLAMLAACNQNSAPQTNINSAQQAQLEGLIRSYLDAGAQNNAAGFAPARGIDDQIAALQPNTDNRRDVNLQAGVSYRIIGVCDNECSNVDMEVRDGAGAVVGSDVLADDIPIVNLTPPANGRYSVRLILKTCTLAPCYVGGRVLQQTAATQSLAKVQPMAALPPGQAPAPK